MERVVDEAWEDLDDVDLFQDPPDALLADGDEPPPPASPNDPPRRPRRPRGPRPEQEHLGNAVMLVAMMVMGALFALSFVTMSLGARGGQVAVYVVAAVFALIFLGTFVLGSVWLGRMRAR